MDIKIDLNNNKIGDNDVSSESQSTFPVIVDSFDYYNYDTNDTSDADYDEKTDEMNRNYYQKGRVLFNSQPNLNKKSDSPATKQSPAKSLTGQNDVDDDDSNDEMYKSLRRMSKALNNIGKFSQNKSRSASVIPFQPNKKKILTCVLNETYCTDGKSSVQEISRTNKDHTEYYSKRQLFKKTVRCIGTSLKHCVQSDVISIDIDSASTYLPLMCKLMIVVQGAVLERGTPELVRDIAIQVGSSDEIKKVQFIEKVEKIEKDPLLKHNVLEESDDSDSIFTRSTNSLMSKYEKNTTISKSNQYTVNKTNLHELHIEKRLVSKTNKNNNNNNRKKPPIDDRSINLLSGRRDSFYRRQSYFNLDEYVSIPYYQYQDKRVIKIDAESNTDESYFNNNIKNRITELKVHVVDDNETDTNKKSNETLTSPPIKIENTNEKRNEEEEVEVNIPVNVVNKVKFQDNSNNNNSNNTSARTNNGRLIYKNTKTTIFEERYNRFEAEIRFINLKDGDKNRAETGASSINGDPTEYTFYKYKIDDRNCNENGIPLIRIKSSGNRSVTHLYFGHVVDGRLLQ